MFTSLWNEAADVFSQTRVGQRLRDLSIGLLACTGRGTVAGMITGAGKEDHDWSSNYRAFSRSQWEPGELFGVAVDHLRQLCPVSEVVVTALDDTKIRKTGTKIPGVSYQRDPMSPPFRPNFIRAQRFVQLSWNVPFAAGASAARAFPVDFRHAPPPPKPKQNASAQQQAEYRKAVQQQNLSRVGVRMLTDFRQQLDQHGASERRHIVSVDGSYTNSTVLKNLPPRTTLIGRIRKDAVLYREPTEQPARGRRRLYGECAPTPEQLREDESVPWQTVTVFAAGRLHSCQVKTIEPVMWRAAGADRRLRMVVIRPLAYRLSKASRILYRQPAYLICTDVNLPLEQLIQYYFWRWDIEVNHRDEKQLIGVGQAQVRAPKAADRLPAFAVLSYTYLLIAAAHSFGLAASRQTLPLPKWRDRSSRPSDNPTTLPRLSTNQILSNFRLSLPPPSTRSARPNFSGFATRVARHAKCSKSLISQAQAIAYATS